MGHNAGQRCLAVGPNRTAYGRPATPIPYHSGASHVTLHRTTMNKQNNHQQPQTRNLVNSQRSNKETRTGFPQVMLAEP